MHVTTINERRDHEFEENKENKEMYVVLRKNRERRNDIVIL